MASLIDSVENVSSTNLESRTIMPCSTADFSELRAASVKADLGINRKADVGTEASIAVPPEGGSHSDPPPPSTTSEMPLGGSSPKARRKRDSELPDPDCCVPMPPPKRRKSRTWSAKRVRFHPEVFDNSLWAELNDAKYASERPPTPFRERTSFATSEEDDFTAPRESALSVTPLADVLPRATPIAFNMPHGGPSFLPRTPASIPFSRNVPAAATGYITDTEISSDTLDSDEAWSVCADCDIDSASRDCDDVSVPRSSPPPSARGMTSASPDHLGERFSVDGDPCSKPSGNSSKDKEKVQDELPSIFTRPPPRATELTRTFSLSRTGTPSPADGSSDSGVPTGPLTQPLFTTGEIMRYSQILITALAKLPADEARVSRDALEQVARWQGQRGYEAGYREGMRSQMETAYRRECADRTLLNRST